MGDRGEQGGGISREPSPAQQRGEKKELAAFNESAAPRRVISFVCIVLFVLWRARSSVPCGISVLSHTQLLVNPPGTRSGVLAPVSNLLLLNPVPQRPLLAERDLPHLAEELQH